MSHGYIELVIEGHFVLVKGFVEGFLAARGRSGRAVYNRESRIETAPAQERLKRWLTADPAARVIVQEEDLGPLEDAVAASETLLDLRILSKRRIREASFRFRFRVFAREAAAALQALLSSPPEGVRVEGYRATERVDGDATGPEAYAPVHDYAMSGAGRVAGDFEKVFWMRRKLEEHEQAELETIDLDLEEL